MPGKANGGTNGPSVRDELRKVVRDKKWGPDTIPQMGILEGYVIDDLEILRPALTELESDGKLEPGQAVVWDKLLTTFDRSERDKLNRSLVKNRRAFVGYKVSVRRGANMVELTLYQVIIRVRDDSILGMDVEDYAP